MHVAYWILCVYGHNHSNLFRIETRSFAKLLRAFAILPVANQISLLREVLMYPWYVLVGRCGRRGLCSIYSALNLWKYIEDTYIDILLNRWVRKLPQFALYFFAVANKLVNHLDSLRPAWFKIRNELNINFTKSSREKVCIFYRKNEARYFTQDYVHKISMKFSLHLESL